MRAESIVLFERVYLARLAIGVTVAALTYWYLLPLMPAGLMGLGQSRGLYAVGAVLIVSILVNGAFIYFIARRASAIAKWLFIVSVPLGAISVITNLFRPSFLPPWLFLLPLFTLGLDCTLIMLLFQKDSREWFARGGVVDEDYETIFS